MTDPSHVVPPTRATRLRLFPPATVPACTDQARHESWCTHPGAHPMINWRTEDGCTGRMCPACDAQYDVKHWPGLAERIAGPASGLDALEMLRALHQGRAGD